KRMNEQHTVDRGIRQRRREFVDQRRKRRPRRRPFQHALSCGHEGNAALGVVAEQPEIRRRIANAEHTLPLRVRPPRPDAAIDQLSRDDPEALGIEVAQVDDINAHVINVTCREHSLRAEYCIAPSALTPYLCSVTPTLHQLLSDGDTMAADIRTFTCLSDNFGYLVHDPETKATASIDAPEAGPVIAAREREGWTLSDILITHHHHDHVGGVAELKQKYQCRVVAPHDKTTKIADVDLRVAHGDVIKVGSLMVRILETPGHTLDHI